MESGLPDAQRTLNWVHLASRYPVRIRVVNPPPELFRVGESAVVEIRGIKNGDLRSKRAELNSTVGLDLGVSQRGARSLSRKGHVGGSHGHGCNSCHAHHHDVSPSLWRVLCYLCTFDFTRKHSGNSEGRGNQSSLLFHWSNLCIDWHDVLCGRPTGAVFVGDRDDVHDVLCDQRDNK